MAKKDRLPKAGGPSLGGRLRTNAVTRPDAPGSVFVMERLHLSDDLVEGILHREMPRLQAVHFGLRQHLKEGFSAFLGEEDVVLAPEDDRLDRKSVV